MNQKAILIFLLIYNYVFSQSIKVGDWRDHLSYNKVNYVIDYKNKIYASTDEALFKYNANSEKTKKINLLNKLSDIGVTHINKFSNGVIIGYSNGNIDILKDNLTINIPDLKNSSIIGSKIINKIVIDSNYAFLACGFGIVVLDLERNEIKENYFIAENASYINIQSLIIDNEYIFASTENGIYFVNRFESNPSNYNNWVKINFRENSNFNLIDKFNEYLILNKKSYELNLDTLFAYNLINDTYDIILSNRNFQNIKKYQYENNNNVYEDLIVVDRWDINIFDEELNLKNNINRQQIDVYLSDFRDVIINEMGYWIADKNNGLINFNQGVTKIIKPDGPYKSFVSEISYIDNSIFLAHGNKNENWDPTWTKSEISILNSDSWSYSNSVIVNEFWDIVSINKLGENIFLGSWQKGIGVISSEAWINSYDELNSSLQKRTSYSDWINIGDIKFDNEGNLWATNSQVSHPISKRNLSGQWTAYSLENISENQNLSKLIIDRNNQKWIQLKNNGLIVFDENRIGSKVKKLSVLESEGSLNSNRVYSIIEDLDGEIWIGSDNGVNVFYNPNQVFLGEESSKITVSLGGYNSYLLDGQTVNDIEIDGGNRKWFALNNSGVVVTSSDGLEEIYHFTTNNSPLFSNKVLDIEFNDNTGEVFMATDKGLISFRSDATKGANDFNKVIVFPNPVKRNYDGLINIKGLISNSIVKITDISGNLVFEAKSNGGSISWNGINLKGEKISTGVYLVFCSNAEGDKAYVTKFLYNK